MGIGDGGQDLGILWIYLFHMKTNRVCVKSVGTMKSGSIGRDLCIAIKK